MLRRPGADIGSGVGFPRQREISGESFALAAYVLLFNRGRYPCFC